MLRWFNDFYLRRRHQFYRKWVRWTFPKSMWHIKDYWPILSIKATGSGCFEVFYRQQFLLKTHAFHELHKAHLTEIYIIGSGPSINQQHLERLQDKPCILLNGASFLLEHYPVNNIFLYAVMDSYFVSHRFEALQALPKGINLLLSLGALRAIAERDIRILQQNRVFLAQNILEPYMGDRLNEQVLKTAFSTDLTQGFVDGGTVMSLAIQLAAFLRITDIYLLGLDIGNAKQPRFYEKHQDQQKSGLLKDYESKILPFMQTAQQMIKSYGGSIYNCSPISKLPYAVIPFSDKFQ